MAACQLTSWSNLVLPYLSRLTRLASASDILAAVVLLNFVGEVKEVAALVEFFGLAGAGGQVAAGHRGGHDGIAEGPRRPGGARSR